jgi:amidophosphoribosyltransferase
MSDPIKHEFGIAFIRLLKPLDYYYEKYGTGLYGINKLYLLMEKQHNRGQDGAGVATIKLHQQPGKKYISRYRSTESSPIQDIFGRINEKFNTAVEKNPDLLKNSEWLKNNVAFTGELLLGHLRYGTFGGNSISHCHPFLRQSNWKTRNLMLAGNFNLTNVDELFETLLQLGQFPKDRSDSVTMLEKIGHFLDEENRRILEECRKNGLSDKIAYQKISEEMNIPKILEDACKKWDGGYVVCGMIGHGDSFITRDPNGIRPAYYYQDDEIFIATSERPAIQTAFNIPLESIQEIRPGSAIVIKKNGNISTHQVRSEETRHSCSFERIYFSRGSDKDIYLERKKLGRYLIPQILDRVDHDFKNSVFSFIPNTAESSFYGMVEGLAEALNRQKITDLKNLGPQATESQIESVLNRTPRVDKIAIKDAKLRTFITEDKSRDDLVAHVYDVTYGTVKAKQDNLVVIDDSIVRGTTLKQSILKILDRLNPKKIVVVSSAPQIRFPDCYGIDMAKMGDFVAFRAAIALLKERSSETLIYDIYERCKEELQKPRSEIQNIVKEIYVSLTTEEISTKIGELLTPPGVKAQVEIIFQSLDNLHLACPDHLGDWYFSGNYPTPGGNRVACQSFVNYIEGKNTRAY